MSFSFHLAHSNFPFRVWEAFLESECDPPGIDGFPLGQMLCDKRGGTIDLLQTFSKIGLFSTGAGDRIPFFPAIPFVRKLRKSGLDVPFRGHRSFGGGSAALPSSVDFIAIAPRATPHAFSFLRSSVFDWSFPWPSPSTFWRRRRSQILWFFDCNRERVIAWFFFRFSLNGKHVVLVMVRVFLFTVPPFFSRNHQASSRAQCIATVVNPSSHAAALFSKMNGRVPPRDRIFRLFSFLFTAVARRS